MIEDVRVSVMYQGNDNQWRIDFVQDGEGRSIENIREVALVSMYHCIAKELNKNHGCSFEYSESEITRCWNSPESSDNAPRNIRWSLECLFGSKWDMMHYMTQLYPTAYGRYYIDEVIAIIKGVGEFVLNNDVHRLSYENCKKHWIQNRDLGIKFKPYEQYQHLFDADPDFSPESFEKARKIHLKRVWDAQSENAVTLWNYPDNEVKVEITSKYVKFFRRDDVFSCYTYPALSELKKDIVFRREIIATLEESNQYDTDEWATWVDGPCDMPPFPISVIFNSEYQNYKFQMYE